MINKSLMSSAKTSWYTPEYILRPVYRFFDGKIDVDPCAGFGSPVKADAYYYGGDLHGCYRSGLLAEWHGNVFMNPPYGREITPWISAFVEKGFDAGIALLPARTDTKWFQLLKDLLMCFVEGRIRFVGADSSAPFPSVFVMRSKKLTDAIRFAKIFGNYGIVK